jgi:hypothetical protein
MRLCNAENHRGLPKSGSQDQALKLPPADSRPMIDLGTHAGLLQHDHKPGPFAIGATAGRRCRSWNWSPRRKDRCTCELQLTVRPYPLAGLPDEPTQIHLVADVGDGDVHVAVPRNTVAKVRTPAPLPWLQARIRRSPPGPGRL